MNVVCLITSDSRSELYFSIRFRCSFPNITNVRPTLQCAVADLISPLWKLNLHTGTDSQISANLHLDSKNFQVEKKSDLQFSDGLPHRSYSSLARKRPIPIESRMCSEGRFESFCLILPESFWPRKFQGSKRKVASISASASKLVSLVSGPIDYVGQGKRSRNQAATAKTTEILAYISLQLCQYFVRKY